MGAAPIGPQRMPLEIERKFLVSGNAWREQAHKRVAMRHGYLTELGAPASVRVRVEGDVGKLNVKQSVVGSTRAEYEDTIPADEIELGSEDEAFVRPSWLGEEVTQLRRYYNNALASHPYSRWTENDGA